MADQAKVVVKGVLEFDPVGQDQWAIDFPAEDKSFGSRCSQQVSRDTTAVSKPRARSRKTWFTEQIANAQHGRG